MSEFKGTKGKWEITSKDLSESGGFIRIGTKKDTWIAETKGCHVGTTNEEALYNAKLIACAPKMLQKLIELSYDFEDEELEELIEKATS